MTDHAVGPEVDDVERIYTREELDEGTIAVLVERYQKYRLPRARRLLEDVRNGQQLTAYDIQWLKAIHRQGRLVRPLVARHPEWGPLIAKAISLYVEIIETGLANEPGS